MKMHYLQRAVIVSILVVYAKCQSLNDLDIDTVKDVLDKSLGGLNIPDLDLNNTNLPNVEDLEKVFRQKCEKNNAPNAVDLLLEEQEASLSCLESYLNLTAIEEELDKAKLTGSMDEVFAKYCAQWPEIKNCFANATDLLLQCMEPREIVAFNDTMKIVDDLQEFMCFKEGDRLAMFVAEGGIECLEERQSGIESCVNQTLGSRIPNLNNLSVTNLPIMLFTEQDCVDFEVVRGCIVKELELCKESTPANIVDAFFKFLKKQLPCKGSKAQAVQQSKPGSSWAISSSSLLIFISLLYVRLY